MLIGCMRVGKAEGSQALDLGGSRRAPRGGRRHECLRRATASAHRALEATLQDAGCFASADGYRRYLAAVAPLYAALEATLDAAQPARLLADWPRRRKFRLILAELRAAGRADVAMDQPLPDLARRDPASAWYAGDVFGTLCVLEGATLGGAALARKLRDLGALAPKAACLLDPYGAERGAMWRAFLDRLEAANLTRQEDEALCPRAIATFSLFAAVGKSLMDREAMQ